jgi:hypothetical protein
MTAPERWSNSGRLGLSMHIADATPSWSLRRCTALYALVFAVGYGGIATLVLVALRLWP